MSLGEGRCGASDTMRRGGKGIKRHKAHRKVRGELLENHSGRPVRGKNVRPNEYVVYLVYFVVGYLRISRTNYGVTCIVVWSKRANRLAPGGEAV